MESRGAELALRSNTSSFLQTREPHVRFRRFESMDGKQAHNHTEGGSMKTRIGLVLCLVLILAAAVSAQQNLTLSVFAGYSMSAFENQGSAAGAIPLGVSLGVKASPELTVGGEFFYPLGGYKFGYTDSNVHVTSTFTQMMIGAFGKYLVGSGNIKPFLKAGIGYYFGDEKVEADGYSTVTDKVKGAVGFNVGGGIQMESGLSFGFTYNIVSREIISGRKMGMNTWAVLVGYPLIK
jgi:hypothetical protein